VRPLVRSAKNRRRVRFYTAAAVLLCVLVGRQGRECVASTEA